MVDITFRNIIGRPLTADEIDDNFLEIKTKLEELEPLIASPNTITNVTVSGRYLRVYTSDGTVYGPFTLATASFRWRGTFMTTTAYYELDLFEVYGDGLYLVLHDHLSGTSFDAAASNSVGPLYKKLAPSSANPLTRIADTTLTPTQEQHGVFFNIVSGCTVSLGVMEAGTEFHFRQGGNDPIVFETIEETFIDGMLGYDAISGGKGAVVTAKYDHEYDNWFLWGRLAPVSA
jgi:hypothetical protein